MIFDLICQFHRLLWALDVLKRRVIFYGPQTDYAHKLVITDSFFLSGTISLFLESHCLSFPLFLCVSFLTLGVCLLSTMFGHLSNTKRWTWDKIESFSVQFFIWLAVTVTSESYEWEWVVPPIHLYLTRMWSLLMGVYWEHQHLQLWILDDIQSHIHKNWGVVTNVEFSMHPSLVSDGFHWINIWGVYGLNIFDLSSG